MGYVLHTLILQGSCGEVKSKKFEWYDLWSCPDAEGGCQHWRRAYFSLGKGGRRGHKMSTTYWCMFAVSMFWRHCLECCYIKILHPYDDIARRPRVRASDSARNSQLDFNVETRCSKSQITILWRFEIAEPKSQEIPQVAVVDSSNGRPESCGL